MAREKSKSFRPVDEQEEMTVVILRFKGGGDQLRKGFDTAQVRRAAELARLRFIRRAQALGFSLKEIRELLALSKGRDVARVKRAAQAKLADVEQRMAALQRMHDGLAALIAACPGHGEPTDCPILRAPGAEGVARGRCCGRSAVRAGPGWGCGGAGSGSAARTAPPTRG